MQKYLMATQNNIILACCALHNFMRDHVPNDAYFVEEEAVGALGQPTLWATTSRYVNRGIADWNEDRRAIADHMYYHQY